MSSMKDSEIADWFLGKYVLITGSTGFMGKVLMAKLLRDCCDLEKLYIMMRPKRGKQEEERLKDIFALPLFDEIRNTKAFAFGKVEIIKADIMRDDLGVTEEDRKKLIDNVEVVYNYAAQLRLEADLKDSVEMNVSGTQRLLNLCKEMKQFICFVHLSTAFCSTDIQVLEEKVYDPPADPYEIMKMVRWMKREAIVKVTPDLIKPHPNTYVYTKRLAETIVANEAKNLKALIFRPSIVGPAAVDPIPGWVDTLNGPMGIVIASGKGALRTMHAIASNSAHVVPVDLCTNAVIVASWKLGRESERPSEIPVYNLTNDEVVKITWGEVLSLGRTVVYKYPFEMQMWYPNGGMHSNYKIHFVCSIFAHWLPAVAIDALMFLLRQKRFMIRIQKRIYRGLELLQFFANRQWHFKTNRCLNLSKELKGRDKELYAIDFLFVPIEQYMRTSILGARQYCLKENLKSLPRCRVILKIFYILDTIVKVLVLYGAYYFAWSKSKTVRNVSNIIRDFVKILPYIMKTYIKQTSFANA